jgi:hypothetical protein
MPLVLFLSAIAIVWQCLFAVVGFAAKTASASGTEQVQSNVLVVLSTSPVESPSKKKARIIRPSGSNLIPNSVLKLNGQVNRLNLC